MAKVQNNSGNLISVEPDFMVWSVAEVRGRMHYDKFDFGLFSFAD